MEHLIIQNHIYLIFILAKLLFQNRNNNLLETSYVINSLINVSNKFDTKMNCLNKNSNTNLFNLNATITNDLDLFITNYLPIVSSYTKQTMKDELVNKTNLLVDSPNPLSSNLGIILALYSYYKRWNDTNFDKTIATKNLLNNNSEILVFKNKNGSLLDIKYGEIIGTKLSINESLWNDKKHKVSINSTELNQIINQNVSLTPAKVTIIYDLDNNIVNSDFAIDSNGYGDGSYDSEQTIIDNALNTLIFNQDVEYVYYVDNNQSTLVKNSINQIYSLKLNDKTYYYPTFKDARNELKGYINLNAKHFK